MIIFNDKSNGGCVIGEKHRQKESEQNYKMKYITKKTMMLMMISWQIAQKNTQNYLSHHKYKTKCNMVNREENTEREKQTETKRNEKTRWKQKRA